MRNNDVLYELVFADSVGVFIVNDVLNARPLDVRRWLQGALAQLCIDMDWSNGYQAEKAQAAAGVLKHELVGRQTIDKWFADSPDGAKTEPADRFLRNVGHLALAKRQRIDGSQDLEPCTVEDHRMFKVVDDEEEGIYCVKCRPVFPGLPSDNLRGPLRLTDAPSSFIEAATALVFVDIGGEEGLVLPFHESVLEERLTAFRLPVELDAILTVLETTRTAAAGWFNGRKPHSPPNQGSHRDWALARNHDDPPGVESESMLGEFASHLAWEFAIRHRQELSSFDTVDRQELAAYLLGRSTRDSSG